jgi:hypothetical protein
MPLDQNQAEHHGHDANAGFKILVSYNGVKHEIEVLPHETIKQVLERAIATFPGLPNPHTLSLFTAAGELPDAETVQAAGIHPHDELLLRPGAVKGG